MGFLLGTELVDEKSHGVLQIMGYLSYGLRQIQLYVHSHTQPQPHDAQSPPRLAWTSILCSRIGSMHT